MKTTAGEGVHLHAFLTSALDGSVSLAIHPGRFTPCKETAVRIQKGGWVGSKVGLDVLAKKRSVFPAG
jgi:hypothetical protein